MAEYQRDISKNVKIAVRKHSQKTSKDIDRVSKILA